MTRMPAAVAERLRSTRGERVAAERSLRGGANSEVWEVTADSGRRYLAKRYPPRAAGETDRLETEFGAFAFLRSHGVDVVPEPVCTAPGARVGVYEFIAGRRLHAGEVGPEEVRQAAALLAALHGLRGAAGADRLPPARESCFSLAAHVGLVRGRLQRLRGAVGAGADPKLAAWLDEELAPHLERVVAHVHDAARRAGLDPAAELPQSARTLSPSDFGFHNAIRRADGRLAFVDFEYFGWDDPAKTVADFLLQPAVPVPRGLWPQFLASASALYDPPGDLGRRLRCVYALLAVKWCLIALNVFLRPGGEVEPARREAQAERARALLGRARDELDAGAFAIAGGLQ